MARLFDDSNEEYLENGSFTASVPFAIVAWSYSDTDGARQTCVFLGEGAADQDAYQLDARLDEPGDPLRFAAWDADTTTSGVADSITAMTLNSWEHMCGIEVASDEHRALLNGGNKGTDSTSVSVEPIDTARIGARQSGSFHMSGMIAEIGIYDLSVYSGATDSDKADDFEDNVLPALADGFSPLCFPLGLAAYWPLIGRHSPEIDPVGAYDMTLNSSDGVNFPSAAEHPRIIYPTAAQVAAFSEGAVGLSPAVAAYYYRMMRTGGC